MTETKKEYIKKKLIEIHSTVTIDKKFNLQDVNTKAEEIFRQVLNATYSWKLTDANKKIKNFPAIDLIDESKEIVLQVTSSLGTSKINDTIKGFEKFKDDLELKKYSKYRLIFCYIVKEKEVRSDKFLSDRGLRSDNFIDITDILEALDESNDGRVYEVLRGIYVEDKQTKKIETNIKGNITGVGNMSGGTFNQTTNNYYTSQEKTEPSDTEIKNSTQILALKALLKDMPIEKLKIKAYKYLPISYFASLPNSVEGLIDRLLELSMVKEGCVPIIALFENHPHKTVIDFVQYLKRVKFSHIQNFICSQNPKVEELSILINISQQDGTDNFKVETWRYANSETHRLFDEILEIDLDNNIELNSFLDKIYDYLEEARRIYKSRLSIELILPNERVYQSFKAWENSKGISMIRKYQHVHRLQSRFLQPDDNWKNKWEALEDNKIDIVDNTKFIEGFSYNNELSNANYKVVLKEKIENETLLFSDMEEFGIPILLSSLSKVCNVKEIKDFEFKGCQNKICTHIMDNHNNEKSDIFFMVDNPNKIPNEFKNPEQNLYDW